MYQNYTGRLPDCGQTFQSQREVKKMCEDSCQLDHTHTLNTCELMSFGPLALMVLVLVNCCLTWLVLMVFGDVQVGWLANLLGVRLQPLVALESGDGDCPVGWRSKGPAMPWP